MPLANLPDKARDPHRHWAEMRAIHSVAYSDRVGSWLVVAHNAAIEVIKAPDRFELDAYRDLPPSLVNLDSSFLLDGADVGPFRESVGQAMRGYLQDQRAFIATCAAQAARLASGTVQLVESFLRPLSSNTLAERVGFRGAMLDRVLAAFYLAETEQDTDARQAAREMATDALLNALAHGRKPGSLPDHLWECWRVNRLPAEWLAAFIAPTVLSEVRGAGLQLAIHAIAGVMSEPRTMSSLNAEVPSWTYCRAIAAEAARWEPVNQVLPRRAVASTTIAGTDLNEGDRILIVLPAVCRDESHHQEPDRFIPARKEFALAFGLGARSCMGRELSLARAAHVIQALWRSWRVEPGPVLPSGRVTFGIRIEEVPARLIRR